MGMINISFDNKIYNVDESSLSPASAAIKSHLLNEMNGSGVTINFGGDSYNVDSEKLLAVTNMFANHLNTIAGDDCKVVVNGIEYNVDSSKINNAVQNFHVILGDSNSDNSQQYRAGLYQTGAFDVYEQGGDIDSMMITSWDELIDGEAICVDNNELFANWSSSNTLYGDLFIINDGSVKRIAQWAFDGSNISGVVIPDCITSIGENAFVDCENLENIKIPSTVASIEPPMAYGCYNLQNIIVDKNNKYYHVSASGHLVKTASKTLVFSIDVNESTIPSDGSITKIGDYAFSGSPISSLVIPNCITHIGQGAFSLCENLTHVVISDHITTIESYSFEGCSSLTEINIPDNVTTIGEAAFCGSSLINVKIPNGVTTIGDAAFFYCPNLISLEIPSTVTHIGVQAFSGCINLSSIIVDEANCYYHVSSFGHLVESASRILIKSVNNESAIPSDGSVTRIGQYAFSGSAISNLVIPDCITHIEDGAFSDCENLTHVFIPDSVIFIGNGAFSGCTKLTNAEFEVYNGWQVEIQGAVASGNLSNPSTAASYLRDIYAGQSWSRTA